MPKPKFSKEQLTNAVANSFSIAGTLRNLNYEISSGCYRTIHRYIKEFQLDTSHWTGQGHLKGKKHNWAGGIDYNLLTTENSISKNHGGLKKKLIKNGILKPELGCSVCGIKDWLNKRLVLQMDHINGIRNDNRVENLRLICPNCHSQTDTFSGKNINKIGSIIRYEGGIGCKPVASAR